MEQFLNTLFAEALAENRRLCVFTLPDRRARHFSSLTAAALHAAEEAKTKDVYFGVGLAGTNFNRRNAASEIVAIVGLWADIDLTAPWRATKLLPRTLDEARTILEKLPLAPSMLVDSGHGLHAYWFFKEPWTFETDAERLVAAKTARGWVETVRNAAQAFGWDVDSVGDLARVLRLPGTVNRKGEPPVEVRVIESNDRRYNPCDFETFMAEEIPAETPEVQVGALELRPDAEPPADKFQRLRCGSQKFSDSWNQWRGDFADQSQSAYDQSLADIAALNGWDDQEIADLLIAVRRRHGHKPEKALRADYIAKTIALARRSAQERSAEGVDLSKFAPGQDSQSGAKADGQPAVSTPKSLGELIAAYPSLRPPVIEGLLRQGETMNVIAPSKTGKALAIDTPILTDSGWTTMGDICRGMKVHACDGTLTEVIAVSEIMHGRPCYRVTTKSGASVVADENHLWLVRQGNHEQIVTTKNLSKGRQGQRWRLPVAASLVRDAANLPLDPWLLGYWLGNGTAREGEITINSEDFEHARTRFARAGFQTGRVCIKGGATTLRVLGLQSVLRQLRLLNNKHIPPVYLTASAKQRADLLAGLLDSDGYAATLHNGSGQIEFTSTDTALAMQAFSLVRSLGYKASCNVQRAMLNGIDCGPKIRITFAASRRHSPFSLPRKTNALPARALASRSQCDGIVSVIPVPSVPVRCIQVAHPTGTYLAGETFMVTHNSWLVIDLALAIATGRPWLGMDCVQGDVLILDNELHGETSANRIPKVAERRGIDIGMVANRLYVENLRGRLVDLFALGPYFKQFAPGRFKVVILDAFYRFLPMRADENDNGTMASLYNYLDSYADHLKCSFVIIHHTSKGNQSLKEVTDVGAGAGAQSRATDTHLVLRRHEEEDAVVMEAAVRSWPPKEPICLRWAWPLWMPDESLDPTALRKEGGRKSSGGDGEGRSETPAWTVESFVARFINQEPKSQTRIVFDAEQAGLSSRKVARFLELAEEDGLIHRWYTGPRRTLFYATTEPPEDEQQDDSRRAGVEALIKAEPGLSTKDVAERCGVSRQYVNRIRREVK